MRDWPFLHKLRTLTTTASTQFKPLPFDIEQVESVFVTVSSIRYTPKLLHSREDWDLINRNSYNSDIPEYAFVYNGELGLWPTPATSGNTVSVNGKVRVADLSIADYTTGTVDTATNGDETITGSGTTWTKPMVGRWLRITESDVVASSGDHVWYEIASRTSNTELELVRKYNGTSLTTGAAAAYIIGQMPLLPEAFHDLPVLKAVETYWDMEGNHEKALTFKRRHDEGLGDMLKQYVSNITDPVLEEGEDRLLINPNLVISL